MLALICALAFFTSLGSTPLWEPDEPRFAAATRHMIESRDYLHPWFNGRPRWEKPVLLYWLQALPMRLGVPAEWSARLPASVAGAAAVAGVYGLGTLWWTSTAGLVAAGCLATSFRFATYARQGLTDLPALAAIVLPFLAFEYATAEPASRRRRWAWWAGWALVGVTALVKGPLAAIAPAIWLGVTRLRRRGVVGLGGAAAGLALAGLVSMPWYAYMALGHGRSFLDLNIGYEVVRRFADQSFPGPSRGALFYWRILAGEIAPWSLVVAVSAAVVAGRWRTLDAVARHGATMAAAWFFGVMVLCSLSQYKLPHYSLPAYPPAFLIAGLAVGMMAHGRDRRPLAAAIGVSAATLIAVGLLAAVVSARIPPMFRGGSLAVAAGAVLGGAISALTLRRSPVAATLAMAGGVAAVYAAVAALLLPALAERGYPYPALGRIVAARAAPDAALGALGVHTSLVFYAGRTVEFLDSPASVAAFLDSTEARLAVLSTGDLEAVRAGRPLTLTIVASRRERNPRLSHLLDGRFVRGSREVVLVANEAAMRSMRGG